MTTATCYQVKVSC